EAGIQVLSVGVGGDSGAPIPVFDRRGEFVDYKKDENGQMVLTRLDRAGLTAIAQATGGEFFYQPQGVALGQVLLGIDKMQKSELESRVTVRYDERFQSFLLPGLLLLVLGMLLLPSAQEGPVSAPAAQRPSRGARLALTAVLLVGFVQPSRAHAAG